MRVPPKPVVPRPRLQVGDKVKIRHELRRWTVRAVTHAGRFAILTRPWRRPGAPPTVLYTVIDFDRGVRGTDDHYGLGYETDAQVADALHFFQHEEDDAPPAVIHSCGRSPWGCGGRAEVSHRSGNHVELDIESVNGKTTDRYGRVTHPTPLDTALERVPDLTPSPPYPGLVIRAGQMENA